MAQVSLVSLILIIFTHQKDGAALKLSSPCASFKLERIKKPLVFHKHIYSTIHYHNKSFKFFQHNSLLYVQNFSSVSVTTDSRCHASQGIIALQNFLCSLVYEYAKARYCVQKTYEWMQSKFFPMGNGQGDYCW